VIIACILITSCVFAQIEKPGIPRSFSSGDHYRSQPVINLIPPDLNFLDVEDRMNASLEKPYRVGVTVDANLDITQHGEMQVLSDGSKLYFLHLKCEGAEALGIDYYRFNLPPGADLYIYNSDHSNIIGAFTHDNNSGEEVFATRPITGDELILEYYQPWNCFLDPEIRISGLNFIYRGMNIGIRKSLKNFGGSGPCEVNVNCTEGNLWKPQVNGVVRILARVKNQSFWCTGSIMNNSAEDFTPLVLTANHCSESGGLVSTPTDVNKWIFYFNYESDNCEDPVSEPVIHSMVGAVKLAASADPTEIGSDFYLVKLNQKIPAQYYAYYNGWSRATEAPVSGVCIHHPQGDIKKISTYTEGLKSGSWSGIPNTHWIVEWVETTNGFGVTEAGSSGSPIFDTQGLVIGALTGGESSCSNTTGVDYYGKVEYSWSSNGTADSMQLKPWLDPLNLDPVVVQGEYNDKQVSADFYADTTIVRIGGTLNFFDNSFGQPESWHWVFDGAVPAESTEQNPTNIKYPSFGKYTVKLTVINANDSDSLTRVDYIDVKAMLSPNPTKGIVYLIADNFQTDDLRIDVYSEIGKWIFTRENTGSSSQFIEIQLPKTGNVFFIKITGRNSVQVEKVIVVRS
jgi:PKD repeat protein